MAKSSTKHMMPPPATHAATSGIGAENGIKSGASTRGVPVGTAADLASLRGNSVTVPHAPVKR